MQVTRRGIDFARRQEATNQPACCRACCRALDQSANLSASRFGQDNGSQPDLGGSGVVACVGPVSSFAARHP